jgi:hypothetical protein
VPAVLGILSHEKLAVLAHDVSKELWLGLESRRVGAIVAAAPANPFRPFAIPVLVHSVAAASRAVRHDNLPPEDFSTSLLNDFQAFAGISLNRAEGLLEIERDTSKLAKEITISLQEKEVTAGQELHGRVAINYTGRWDSVVIYSQIENSSDVFSYSLINGRKVNHPYARLSIFRTELKGATAVDFVASTKHAPPPAGASNVKLRVSLIQEHKEIYSDVAYIRVVAAAPGQ